MIIGNELRKLLNDYSIKNAVNIVLWHEFDRVKVNMTDFGNNRKTVTLTFDVLGFNKKTKECLDLTKMALISKGAKDMNMMNIIEAINAHQIKHETYISWERIGSHGIYSEDGGIRIIMTKDGVTKRMDFDLRVFEKYATKCLDEVLNAIKDGEEEKNTRTIQNILKGAKDMNKMDKNMYKAPHVAMYEARWLTPTRVIFSDNVTVVFFPDGDKQIVRLADGEAYDAEKAVMYAIMKKMLGNNTRVHKMFKNLGLYDEEDNSMNSFIENFIKGGFYE